MAYNIREMRESEYPLLEDFLYEAIFIPEGAAPPPKSMIHEPLLWRTIAGFGRFPDDYCLLAEVDGKAAGAVWVRTQDQYGHLDDKTPSFSISLYRDYRGRGIGAALMKAMLAYLEKQGYERASLSVQKENYAVKLYRSVGFYVLADNGEEYIMQHDF